MAADELRIVTALTLSIVTGDSKILEGVRVADTTTSCPNELLAAKLTCTNSVALLTRTSCREYPIELTIKVNGVRVDEESLKLPLSSVVVPLPEPFTVTDTADRGSLSVFLTLPFITTFWAKDENDNKPANSSIKIDNLVRIMVVLKREN